METGKLDQIDDANKPRRANNQDTVRNFTVCCESLELSISIQTFQTSKMQDGYVNNYRVLLLVSMTSLLMDIVAHSTRPSFGPKTNNQHLKKFLSLAVS